MQVDSDSCDNPQGEHSRIASTISIEGGTFKTTPHDSAATEREFCAFGRRPDGQRQLARSLQSLDKDRGFRRSAQRHVVSICQQSSIISSTSPVPRLKIGMRMKRSGGMDWKLAMEEERAALMRFVALLFAFADLAELACGRSRAVRGFVLWLLRRAEAVARDFVTDAAGALPASMPVDPAGDRPEDAMLLARSFRALARQLDTQARLLFAVCREDRGQPLHSGARRMQAPGSALNAMVALAFPAFAGRAPHLAPVPDTS